ncbi:PD-(D/E)XK nuclease family protein [Limnothrix redekei]|uniref:PD-(D/E)XK nuclease family protein n=1 Tax=Limnothrix redekei LRLZ20PSL1 TaxID=3112953 RepID=A0ABW7C7E6_9CYAN
MTANRSSVNTSRTIWLGAKAAQVQRAIAQGLWGPFDWVLTPTRQAARAIGVQAQSLDQLLKRLRLEGNLAPVLMRQRALRSAVAAVWPEVEAGQYANTIAPVIREMLHNGWSLAMAAQEPTLSDRARRLVTIAQAYLQALQLSGDQKLGDQKLGDQQLSDQKWGDQQLGDQSIQRRAVDRPADRLDAAQIYGQAAQAIAQGAVDPLVLGLWGYGYLAPDAIALIDALAGPGSCLWWPDDPALHRLLPAWEQRGWTVRSAAEFFAEFSAESEATASPTECQPWQRAIAFPTLEDEVRWVLAKIKQHLHQGVPANQMVLIARDEQRYGPKLLEVAQEFEVPVRLLYGVPLTQTRVGHWVQCLLEAAQQQWAYEPAVQLLRHPLGRDRLEGQWETARRLRPDRPKAWIHAGLDLTDLAPPAQSAHRSATREQWVSWVQDCARSLEIRSGAQHWPSEANALSSLNHHLIELARPSHETLTLANFAQELRELLSLISVPRHPGRGGVELHSPASLIGAQYRYGFALGMVEGWWPAPIAPDLALDWFDRRALTQAGFPMAGTAELADQERLHNSAAFATIQEQLVFSYPQWHGQQPQSPSALLRDPQIKPTEPEPVPDVSPLASWQRFLTRPDRPADLAQDPFGPVLERAWRMEYQRLRGGQPDRPEDLAFHGFLGSFATMDPDRHTFSASQITDLGQCPFKYFARRVLRLQEPQETEADLPRNSKGNLYHRVLQKLGEQQRDRQAPVFNDPEQRLAALETWLTEAATELQLPRHLTWTAQRQELLAQLQWLILQDTFLPAESTILHCEVPFEGEWLGLKVKGMIDRVDQSPDGLVLIDYKTGKAEGAKVKDQTGQANLDVQLLVYASAAAQLAPETPVAKAYYYSLREAKLVSPQPLTSDNPEVGALVQRLRHHLAAGEYPVDPDREYKACQFCEASSACRCVQDG